MSINNIVHVAVAVIKNREGQYLIAERPKGTSQGGLWEFPGGKVEKDETVVNALKRELFEELNINISTASPLIQIHHNYGNETVFLEVFNINSFSGVAVGKEGQEIRWINGCDFSKYKFPDANTSIITAAKLPDKYMITGKFSNKTELLLRISSGIEKGIKLIQFRAPGLNEDMYFDYAKNLYERCEKNNVQLLLNTTVRSYNKYRANKFSHGIHFNANEIKNYSAKQFNHKLLISTSTHNIKELDFAISKNIDFVVLSPVKETLSHPDAIPLGWNKFKTLTKNANIPVYALGGMKLENLNEIKLNGGQGIAAIGEFWNV